MLPTVTTAQMQTVDGLMIEKYRVELLQMMELAGHGLAALSRFLLGGDVHDKRIVVLAGRGNNGGGGLAAARHLHNWGADVTAATLGALDSYSPAPAHQLAAFQAGGGRITQQFDHIAADLILDAMIGYGIKGDPQTPFDDWIRLINQGNCAVIALDIPSGLDGTSGVPGTPCVRADATLTLAMPKTGLVAESARDYVGDLYLADIGVPDKLLKEIGLHVKTSDLFSRSSLVMLKR